MRGPKFLLPQRTYETVRVRSRGYLPHWDAPEGTYFVTFRLADSLPRAIYDRIASERQALIRLFTGGERSLTAVENDQIRRFTFSRTDESLDQGYGNCWMRQSEIADVVANSLRFFDGRRYTLHAWCVMPNHVHVLITLRSQETLDRVLHSWKSFSSSKANEILGKTGSTFWEHESFDRLVRSDQEFFKVWRYILANPGKAGLKAWRWVGCEHDERS